MLTPEDSFEEWPGEGNYVLAPTFTLYDYTFCPNDVAGISEEAVNWARETGIFCADENFLYSNPYPSMKEWCQERCRYTEQCLERAARLGELIIINHYPLRQEHAVLPLIPRFRLWCGTQRTEDWHVRWKTKSVIYGHLHIRQQHRLDGVRFEEVSLGYPRQWNQRHSIESYLRKILSK